MKENSNEWEHCLEKLFGYMENWVKLVLTDPQNISDLIFIEKDMEVTNPIELAHLLNYFINASISEKNQHDYHQLYELRLAFLTDIIIKGYKTDALALVGHHEILNAMFNLGKVMGQIQILSFNFKGNHLHAQNIRGMLGSIDQKQKRWERSNKERSDLLEEIRNATKDYYDKGGTKIHHDFAINFKTLPKYGDRYNKISLKVIRKIVGEVAGPFGYKSGVQKKEKI